ncbi:MAG: ASKHA domain-containing protein [Candidatus Latescibacteria bacterium]|nr:ASKHA domain-containing protein [Candidatus Latescibacterota bacterium]
MSTTSVTLTTLPDNLTTETASNTTVLEAVTKAGIQITTPCGHIAHCGKCRVVVTDGVSPPSEAERAILSPEDLAEGIRLACQTHLMEDASVFVPSASRATEMRVLIGGKPRQVPFDPALNKKSVTWTEQTLGNAISEFDHLNRLMDVRADLTVDLPCLRSLPAICRESNEVTGVVCGERLIAVESGDTTSRCYGLACDVGTTTVVGTLVDLITGREMGSASSINNQTQYGHDVISRINHTLEQGTGLADLQQAVVDTLNLVIEKLLTSLDIDPEAVYEMTVVGNATMVHFLLGIPARSLGFLPYVPVVNHAMDVEAQSLGIRINPSANIHVLPSIAGFVGADTVGALLTAGMDENDGTIQLLADVGTNCEIVLRQDDRLIACSTPAGPAFEGARIKHGMYALPGAIEQVALDEDCTCKVIGRGPPQGICGSGLVDIGAELFRTGMIDETGRLLTADELDREVSASLSSRLVEENGDLQFVLATTETAQPIALTQRDVRELQVAKAAIRSGIDALLAATGLQPSNVSNLYLAGGFGSYLNKEHAIRLGMIPDMPLDRIKFIGNAAIVGAKLALISQEMRRRARQVAETAEHLQLADRPDFQMRFADAMMFM